jgi:hypothetical protein
MATFIDGGDAFSSYEIGSGSYSPASRTVADVMKAVKRSFGDESGVQLEESDIIMWINDAQDEIVKRNRILKATSSTVSVVGQQDYSFPSDNILQIESLHYNGVRLPNMSFAEAEEKVVGLDPSASSGEPILWYEWGGKFSLYPVPQTAQTIVLYYTKSPAKVALSTDLLSVTDKYYQDVVRYVLQQAYEMDEDPNMSQLKQKQFDDSLNALGEEERTAQNMTYSTITLVD